VIKDRDDLIAELMAKEDSDDDGGAKDHTKEDLEKVPEGEAPQEQLLIEEDPQEEAPH
jgi:hypothetical protein